jgi:Tannase and feruloyl esterase
MQKLARPRSAAYLAAALSIILALGVFVGVAQAGPTHLGHVAANRVLTSDRVVSNVAASAVIAPAESCATIGQADFSALSGASTTILSATSVSASSNTLGDYAGCEISGLIAPQIQFQLMLPTQNYQGKYLQLGCGGYCGTDTLSTPAASYGCVPVTSGQFAEATDNEGHSGAVFSGAFAADLNLRVDFGYASEHALAVAAKATGRPSRTSTAARRAVTKDCWKPSATRPTSTASSPGLRPRSSPRSTSSTKAGTRSPTPGPAASPS